MAPTTLTTPEVASRLRTDPRTLRRFFRSQDSPIKAVGTGRRYQVRTSEVKALRKAFSSWQAEHTRKVA